jgi:hypothetical protein
MDAIPSCAAWGLEVVRRLVLLKDFTSHKSRLTFHLESVENWQITLISMVMYLYVRSLLDDCRDRLQLKGLNS